MRNVIILITSVFNKDKNNYYYNIFLEKGSYQLAENNDNKYIMVELTFLKESILIRQVNQKSMIFDTIGTFYIKNLSFNQMSAMGVIMY